MDQRMPRYAPGFYKTNPGAITLREHAAWLGWRKMWRLPFVYLASQTLRPSGSMWMPGLWSSYECAEGDLSARFWEMTKLHREAFARLGFSPCRFTRTSPRVDLNPLILDNSGINYLHVNRQYFGGILYIKSHVPEPVNRDEERVVFYFTAAHESGSLGCTNQAPSFRPLANNEVIRIATDSPEALYTRFLQLVERRNRKLRSFDDLNALRDWFDDDQIKSFESRVERGLFVRMTDAEVEEKRRMLPPPLAGKE